MAERHDGAGERVRDECGDKNCPLETCSWPRLPAVPNILSKIFDNSPYDSSCAFIYSVYGQCLKCIWIHVEYWWPQKPGDKRFQSCTRYSNFHAQSGGKVSDQTLSQPVRAPDPSPVLAKQGSHQSDSANPWFHPFYPKRCKCTAIDGKV